MPRFQRWSNSVWSNSITFWASSSFVLRASRLVVGTHCSTSMIEIKMENIFNCWITFKTLCFIYPMVKHRKHKGRYRIFYGSNDLRQTFGLRIPFNYTNIFVRNLLPFLYFLKSLLIFFNKYTLSNKSKWIHYSCWPKDVVFRQSFYAKRTHYPDINEFWIKKWWKVARIYFDFDLLRIWIFTELGCCWLQWFKSKIKHSYSAKKKH